MAFGNNMKRGACGTSQKGMPRTRSNALVSSRQMIGLIRKIY